MLIISKTLALNLFGKIQKKQLTIKILEAIVHIKRIGLTEHGKGNKIQMFAVGTQKLYCTTQNQFCAATIT